MEGERAADGSTYDAPRFDANVGVGTRLQLKLEAPWRVATAPAQRARSGFGNLDVGVKWRFAEWRTVAVSIYPQLTFAGSASASGKGLADAETSMLLPVEVAWDAGPVSVNAEAGYQSGDGPAELIYGLALARAVRRTLELLGECHGSVDTGFDANGMLCGGGFRWELASAASVLAAFTTGVAGSVDERPDHRVYAGVQLRW